MGGSRASAGGTAGGKAGDRLPGVLGAEAPSAAGSGVGEAGGRPDLLVCMYKCMFVWRSEKTRGCKTTNVITSHNIS